MGGAESRRDIRRDRGRVTQRNAYRAPPTRPCSDMRVIRPPHHVILPRPTGLPDLLSRGRNPFSAADLTSAAFPVQREVTMAWLDHKSLRDQIAEASRELKLARRDGSAEWITKAANRLDELIDQIPRTAQPQGSAT